MPCISRFDALKRFGASSICWKSLGRQNPLASHRYVLAVLLLGLTCLPQIASAAVLTDGDFDGWLSQHWGTEGTAADMERIGNGGNPGPYLEATIFLPSPPAGGEAWAYLLMWSEALVWNPAVDGAVDSIAMQIDVRSVSGWGDGQAIYIHIIQDGISYIGGGSSTTCQTSWHTVSLGPCHSENLWSIDPDHPGQHPDFSPTGSPILLGFSVSTGTHVGYTYIQDYDNWQMAIDALTCVNEPLSHEQFHLLSPHPNPSSGFVALRYEARLCGSSDPVQLDIFDARGRCVRRLGPLPPCFAGDVPWDGTDGNSRPVADGVYFARFRAGGRVLTSRVVIVR